MTNDEFTEWASSHGVKSSTIEELLQFAASPEEMKSVIENFEPAPPIYTLADIKGMTESDSYGFQPLEHGLILVGGCPNGDPIAVDITRDTGAVLYIDHDNMHHNTPRDVAIRVADNLESLLMGLAHDDGFPFDYFSAKQKQDG